MISHADLREMIAPYALGALDQPELGLMEQHLSDCAFCANLAREASDVSHYLAFSPMQHAAPSQAVQRLLDSIQAQPPVRSLQAASAGATGERRRIPRWWRLTSAAAVPVAASLALAMGMAGWNVRLMGELKEDHQEMATLHQRLASQSHALLMVTSQSAVTRALESTALAPSAQVRLIMDAESNSAMVMADHLPSLPNDRIYEVWLGRQGAKMPAARLDVDEQGDGEAALALDGSVHSYDSAWITLEPANGGFMPNSPGIAKGTI
ncbi:MAG TPA: anti-sigma factor [Chloroflexota bacterium]|nr:anti-sigma factor [Chloroflexota bacterium]